MTSSFYGNMFGPPMEGWLRALITTLRSADTKAWAILKAKGTVNRYLQVWAGRGALHAEVVSNEFLTDEEQWSPSQHQQIIDLGWHEPNVPVPGVESPISNLSNYHVSWPGDRDCEAADIEAAELIARTFRDLLGVYSRDQIEATVPEMTMTIGPRLVIRFTPRDASLERRSA